MSSLVSGNNMGSMPSNLNCASSSEANGGVQNQPSSYRRFPNVKKAPSGTKVADMKYQLFRLVSFGCFPGETIYSPCVMAEKGLYHKGPRDEVACFSCNNIISGWHAERLDPVERHKKFYPKCNYLLGLDKSNVPLGPPPERAVTNFEDCRRGYLLQTAANPCITPYEKILTTIGINRQMLFANISAPDQTSNIAYPARALSGSQTARADTSLITETPQIDNGAEAAALTVNNNARHPDKITIQSRIDTYATWPKTQTPSEMAIAGFFYCGIHDCVKCFCCGGGLKNWQPGDDPCIEHGRWYPDCLYILQLKGAEYVRNCATHGLDSDDTSGEEEIVVSEETIERLLLSEQINIIWQMGFPQMQVRQAIVELISGRGQLPSVQALIDHVLSSQSQSNKSTNYIVNGSSNVSQVLSGEPEQNSSSPDQAQEQPMSTTQQGSSNNADDRNSQGGNESERSEGAAFNSDNVNDSSEQAAAGRSSNASSKKKRRQKKKKNNNDDGSRQSVSQFSSPNDIETLRQAHAASVEENKELREDQFCKICYENLVDTLFLPCRHLVCCSGCASNMRQCAICRGKIDDKVKVFRG